jgi:hypothetical protein
VAEIILQPLLRFCPVATALRMPVPISWTQALGGSISQVVPLAIAVWNASFLAVEKQKEMIPEILGMLGAHDQSAQILRTGLKTQREGLSHHSRICPGSSFPQVFGGDPGSCKHSGPPPEACEGDGWRDFLDTL